MKHKYKKQIVDMLSKEWDLGKTRSKAKGKTAGWIYLFEILEESEDIILEIDNGKVIGVCGYAKWNSKKHLFRKNYYHLLKNLTIHSPLIKNKKAMLKYYNDFNYVPKDMKNNFDGEISILILDNNYRGKGLGKKLLLDIFDKAKKDGMKNIQILCDDSCDFKFYEHLGCTIVYETTIYLGEPGNCLQDQCYIYEKKFKGV